jgi:hypothetical protein
MSFTNRGSVVFIDALGQRLFPHAALDCLGGSCAIHKPSAHAMSTWPQVYRHDLGLMERRCPHDVGHVDPDDLLLRTRSVTCLGCDGCCQTRG